MNTTPKRIYAWLGLIALLVTVPALEAQFRGSIRGTVTDPSGSVIPGATVTLNNVETNEKQTSTSDPGGIYNFNALPPGRFDVTVDANGFQKQVIHNYQIIPEQANALDIKLQLGAASQTVTVNGSEAAALDTETASLSGTISANQIQHLPSYNRDVFQLAQLAPGVFGDGSQSGGGGTNANPGNQGPGGSGSGNAGIFATENGPQIQARGGQYENNGISIDGISTVSAVWGGTSIITPSEDSVQDVKVVSNSYDAEVGRFSGGQVQVTTRAGTNQLHGSAFFKASRPGLNAYQRWNGLGSEIAGSAADRGLNRDESRLNNYGGSLGGPIIKNRLFAFFNWETSPLSGSTTAQGWYETSQFDGSAATANSIAATYLGFKGVAVASSGLIQRTCASIGLIEGNNCNTTSAGLDVGSPSKVGLGRLDPTWGGSANQPGVGGGLDGVADLAYYNTLNPTTTTQQQFNGRMDANATQKDHLSFAIYWVPVSSTDYQGPVRAQNLWHHNQTNDAFSVIWNHTFSPTLLNEARANAAGWRFSELADNPQEPFGLPEDDIDDIGSIAGQGGFQYFGAPGPGVYNQWTYSYDDILTKVWGRHNIKAGGELTRLYYLNDNVGAARPTFNFRNLWDFANDAPYQEQGQFDHATGIPSANRQDNRENLWGFFGQDDYKIRPNLTINLGLRWSYFDALSSKQNNLDVAQNVRVNSLQNINVRIGGKLYQPDKWNFGPQFGFAWQPLSYNGHMVIRGGFGVNYNQNEIAITANVSGNPPNVVSASFCCSTSAANDSSILYGIASSPTSIFGYAPNPATITAFSAANLPASGVPTTLQAYDSHASTIANYHYSFDTQYQLPFNNVLSVGYQGSSTRHSLINENYNVIAAADGVALNPLVNFINYWANSGSGNYNALIATLKHNFSHHFQLEGQYAWSKARDENSGPYSRDFYPFAPRAAMARSDYDVTDGAKIFGLWQPVIFSGQHSWLEKAVGGWSLSGIFNWHTGFPWTPTYNVNTAGGLYYNGSQYSQLRPVAVTGTYGHNIGNETFKSAINPNFNGDATTVFAAPSFVDGPAFPATAPPPPIGIQRNTLAGPNYKDLDGSLSKAFGLPNNRVVGENAKFEIRADVYNFFNNTNLNTNDIDKIVGSVNPDGSIGSVNSDFGVAGGALGSRTVQLQARFSF